MRNAEIRLDQAKNELQRLKRAFDDRNNERERVENEIQIQVLRELSVLEDNVRIARQDVIELDRQQNELTSRLQTINNLELPRFQNDLSSLRSRQSGARTELANAQNAVNRSSAAYSGYKQSVNYDALEARADQTLAAVNKIRARISSLQSQVSTNERRVTDQTALRDRLGARIDNLRVTIAQREARLTELEAALVPYDSEKDAVLQKLAAAEQLLKSIQDEFLAKMPR